MYTGLIEETGRISEIKTDGNSMYLTVDCEKVLDGMKIGDSIAINGACQTVIELSQKSFKVFASFETLKITTFKDFKTSTEVNLERTMRLSDRLDGHIVSGHVDGTAKVVSIKKINEAHEFTFEVEPELSKQIVKKGSVTIDGISLTVTEIKVNVFNIAVIPHTYLSTTLKNLKIGDRVNIETDMIAKYIEKYLLSNDNNSKIDTNFLERNGFL